MPNNSKNFDPEQARKAFDMLSESDKNILRAAHERMATKKSNQSEKMADFVWPMEWLDLEQALHDSHATLLHIINTTQDGYLKVDIQGRVVNTNQVYLDKSWYSREELIGMEMSDLDATEISTMTAERTRRVIENGSELFESVHRRKDGTTWPVEVSTTYQDIRGGQLIGFIRDLSEKKKIESEMASANDRMKAMLDALPDILFEIDANGRILNYHTKSPKLLASPPELFLGKSFVEVLPKEASDVCASAIREAEELGVSRWQQYTLDLTHGKRWFELSVSSMGKTKDSPVKKYIFIARDITERKLKEIEITETKNNLEAILGVIPDLLFEIDLDGKLTDFHSNRPELLYRPLEEVIGKNIHEYLPVEVTDSLDSAMKEANETGFSFGKQFSHDLGWSHHHFEISASKKPSDHTLPRFIILRRDITDRINTQRETEKLRIHSDESDRLNEILFQSIPFGMDIVDQDGTILFQNQHLKNIIWNMPHDKKCWETYRDDQKQCQKCPLKSEIEVGTIKMLRSEGVFWGKTFEVFHAGMMFEGKKAFLEIFIDITERKKAEDALEESRFFFQESQRAANVGSYKTDFSKGIWESSEVLNKIFGIDNEYVKNIDGWLEIIHPEDRDMMKNYLLEEVQQRQKVFNKEYRIVHRKSGETRWILGLGELEFDTAGNAKSLTGTIQDITERKMAEYRHEQITLELKKTLMGTIDVISQIVDMRDPYTADHQRKVSVMAGKIARKMGLSEDQITELQMAALIHDIGKISVAAEILSKPSKLKTAEFDLVRDHVQSGYDALRNSGLSDAVKRGVLEHHERLDGTGYPYGLKGDEISKLARILAVADVYDAMSSHRPYRPSLGNEAALVEIRQHRGTRYDPEAVDACWEVSIDERSDIMKNHTN